MGKIVMGPKHKPAERTAIFEPATKVLLTDEQQIREATLKYNVGVLTKNKVQEQDMETVKAKQQTHDKIMNEESKKYGEPLKDETYRNVLKHLEFFFFFFQTLNKGRTGLPGRHFRLHGRLYIP